MTEESKAAIERLENICKEHDRIKASSQAVDIIMEKCLRDAIAGELAWWAAIQRMLRL